MFQACCDCFSGVLKSNDNTDNVSMRQVNGTTQHSPQWPQTTSDDQNIFLVPKPLNSGDQIRMHSHIRKLNILSVSLVTGNNVPDYENVAFHFEANFSTNSINIKTVKNGYNEVVETLGGAGGFFPDDNFEIIFTIIGDYSSGHEVLLGIAQSDLTAVKLLHNIGDIRYIVVSGDIVKVDKLEFKFA